MTYCVGMLVETGLVMIADTRTNAGVDNISTYRKLHMLGESKGRIVIGATAGNLSVTQSALTLLEEGLPSHDDSGALRRLSDMTSMFRAAQLVGEAIHSARSDLEGTLQGTEINTGVSILLGGRIGDEPLKLYLIYSQGNFIECQPDAPFLQIGETKYGKPILDRALEYESPLGEAVKVGLISFDSTMRSNLAVGRPLDLVVVPVERDKPVITRRIDWDDRYFNDLSVRWGLLLNDARETIPDPPFLAPD
ncbi:peptidase [Sphingomonas cavernae]|uniref:Peptidase n=1 Tax=Sphingomonas cavernae TaxID=2320861 RepID=A0A418WKB0_9SPHN|nr:peptidase [Sphingomonas cavernae]RJF90458.1 peptidase [Sphingomonas cavernae]